MTDKERLEIELKKAKEEFEQQRFYVNWLEGQIGILRIKEIIKENKKDE